MFDFIKISIHKIIGLGGPEPERTLIGKGLLRILRCQPPISFISFQNIFIIIYIYNIFLLSFLMIDFIYESPKLPSPQVSTKSELEVEAEIKEELAVQKRQVKESLSLLQLIPIKDDTQFQFPLTKSVPCLCTAPGYRIKNKE